MNTSRLLHLAEFLADLPEELFSLGESVVQYSSPLGVGAFVDVLPKGAKAGPVGWLPGADPEAWCWVVQNNNSVLPVYKASELWSPGRYDFAEFKSSTWQLDLRFWRQVGEWFEIQDMGVLDRLFSWKEYDVPSKRDVVVRLRAAALQ